MKHHHGRAYPVHRNPCQTRQRLAVCCALFSTTMLVLFANALFAVPALAGPRHAIDALGKRHNDAVARDRFARLP